MLYTLNMLTFQRHLDKIYENSACLLLGTPLDKLSFDKVYIFPCLGVAVSKNKNIEELM